MQRRSVAANAGGMRQFEDIGKDSVGDLSPEVSQHPEFRTGRDTPRGESRLGEIAIGPFMHAMVEHPVLPIEVRRQRQGLPHADVLQARPARVQRNDPLGPGNAPPVEDVPRDTRVFRVVGNPMPDVLFEPKVEQPFAESLPRNGVVAVQVVSDLVEVVAASIDGKVASPVVPHAFEAHMGSVMADDAVRSAPEWRHEGRFVRLPSFPVVRGKYAHVSEQLQVGGGEFSLVAKHHLAHAGDLHRIEPVHVDLALDCAEGVVERELHVLRRDRHAIVPARTGMQSKMQETFIGSERHALRQVPVEAAQLVAGAVQEVVVGSVHARRDHRLVVPFVCEIANRVRGREPHRASLGRVRIHVVETLEIRRILEFVDDRNAVTKLQRVLFSGGCERHREGKQTASARKVSQRPAGLAQRANVGANRSPMRI